MFDLFSGSVTASQGRFISYMTTASQGRFRIDILYIWIGIGDGWSIKVNYWIFMYGWFSIWGVINQDKVHITNRSCPNFCRKYRCLSLQTL